MADALARRTEPASKSATGSMTAVDWFRYLEEYSEADTRVKNATNSRKELRDRIKGKLEDPDLIIAFDRARKDREVSGEYRSKLDAAYFAIMAWERKAPNFQGGLAVPLTQAEAARVDLEGLEAGKSKLNRTDNPYTPGQEEFQRWDTCWLRGQAQIGASLTDDKDKKAATLAIVPGGKAPEGEQPKRRGRPPGSGKKQQDANAGAGGTNIEGSDGGPLPQEQGDPNAPPPPGGGEDQGGGGDGDGGETPPERQADGPDKYGQEWPSRNGNGNLH